MPGKGIGTKQLLKTKQNKKQKGKGEERAHVLGRAKFKTRAGTDCHPSVTELPLWVMLSFGFGQTHDLNLHSNTLTILLTESFFFLPLYD